METTVFKKVFFVRHGQTEANAKQTTQGSDNPLSEVGIEQARTIALRAQNLNFDSIISSDYERSKVTAEHIHKMTDKPLEFSELFREYRRPSEFWGKSLDEFCGAQTVEEGYAQIDANFEDANWHYSDEENFFDLKERAAQALHYLENHEHSHILVVTHGNFLRTLLGVMLHRENYSPDDYRDIESTFELFNTSISVAEYKTHWRYPNGTWRISAWNDQAHLGELS